MPKSLIKLPMCTMRSSQPMYCIALSFLALASVGCHPSGTVDHSDESGKLSGSPVQSSDPVVRSDGKKPRDVDYPDGGVELGQGWESTAGQKTNASCIDFTEAKDLAQDKTLDLKEVTDKSSLMNQLDVSAEAQVKGIAGSASAKVKFVSSTKVDEEQSNFSVHARVLNGANFVGPPKSGQIDLKPSYRRLAHSNLTQFLQQCGDSYVLGLIGGAELSAILAFHVYQVDEKKALSVSVSGSGWNTFEASGSVSQTMNKYASSSQFSILYHEAGGSGDPIPTTQEGLVQVIHGLPSLAQSAPKYFTIKLARYDTLPSWPDKKSDWLYTQYAAIASQYGKFSSLHESVVTMIAKPDDYILDHGVSRSDLDQIEGQLLDHLKRLKQKSADCLDSSGANCKIQSQDKVSDYEYRIRLPIRKVACPAYISLQAAIADAPVKHQQYLKVLNYYQQLAEQLRIEKKQDFWGPNSAPARAADEQAAAVLKSQTEQFPEGIRDAIAAQWIELPARARCADDVLSDGCISQADIEKFKKRIVVN